MERALPSVAVLVDQDLPEPTSYRGQHMIALPVDDDAWLRYHGITYWLSPFTDGSVGWCEFVLISDDGAPQLTMQIYDEKGSWHSTSEAPSPPDAPGTNTRSLILKALQNPEGPDTDGPWIIMFPGTSITLRFNYVGSAGVKDVVLPLELGGPVADLLNKRRLYIKLEERPLADTRLTARDRDRTGEKTPLIYLHGYEDPDTGHETIGTRLPPFALTRERIGSAWKAVQETGHFSPAIFPNVTTGGDEAARAGVLRAVKDLDQATVVQEISAGSRLVVSRAPTGEYGYRFLNAPEHCRPGLVLVEHYRLSSFPARYGPGRTIKTFSLLPGERTSIRVSTYKRSSESTQKTSSILDSVSDESESEFGRTVNSEQSNQTNASKTFEYRAETQAQAQGNWGWGSASVSVSGGVSGSSNGAREELTKNITNAVSQNTARASAKRDVQIDTSLDVKLEEGEESAVERTLENINVSRTLNFVFRQMNQEYVTLLHLVDVRVAFFNGHAESRDEVPLAELDRLLADCLKPKPADDPEAHDHIAEVREQVLAAVRGITDHQGTQRPEILRSAGLDDKGPFQIDAGVTSTYTAPDGREHTVPGVIIGVEQHVLRTDGVVVDSFLGDGDALDTYSTGLQEQAVRAREIDNDRQQAENEKLRLALQLIQKGDTAGVDLYRRLFPIPQIVNQIDHAAVNATPNGQQSTADTMTN
ncbi:hypothetical protein ACGFNU_49830 [Spirillospora sp. NPDC048911]|uniref:hypothetical protein n=1 Tax=Spirillospora sp. NPDC048911 TaxID=3364527 RepID=UPI003720C477